jgi:DNA replication and repair protein RecF
MFSLEGRGVEMRARGRISRGQQKLLVCAFVLAQCDMVRAAQGAAPVLLVDDFAAELSADSQSRLAAALAVYPGQLFVAALETGAALEACGDARMFHVEHGKVSALIK